MTRIELLYHVERLTKIELEKRTDEQLLQIYHVLSGQNVPTIKLSKQDAQTFVEQVAVPEMMETLFVSPVIQICDTKYGGNVTVSPGTATQLRYMMQQSKARELRNTQFIDHGTRNLGTI